MPWPMLTNQPIQLVEKLVTMGDLLNMLYHSKMSSDLRQQCLQPVFRRPFDRLFGIQCWKGSSCRAAHCCFLAIVGVVVVRTVVMIQVLGLLLTSAIVAVVLFSSVACCWIAVFVSRRGRLFVPIVSESTTSSSASPTSTSATLSSSPPSARRCPVFEGFTSR